MLRNRNLQLVGAPVLERIMLGRLEVRRGRRLLQRQHLWIPPLNRKQTLLAWTNPDKRNV